MRSLLLHFQIMRNERSSNTHSTYCKSRSGLAGSCYIVRTYLDPLHLLCCFISVVCKCCPCDSCKQRSDEQALEVTDVTETAEVTEVAEAAEVMEVAEAAELTDVIETAEVTEVGEAAEVTEAVEVTEVADVTEVAEAAEVTNADIDVLGKSQV